MIAILNGTLYTPSECIPDGVLTVEGETIIGLGSRAKVPIARDAETFDAQGQAIVPGLVDVHTFGCLGAQLSTPSRAADELQSLARNVAHFGVTAFLVSLPMGTADEIQAMLAAVAAAIPGLTEGARCLGIHLEGPYLDPEQRGAFPREVLREPDLEEITRWTAAANGYLKMVTLAPNLPRSVEVAAWLREKGILASLGHTSADYTCASEALQPRGPFGVVTHLFNAMTGVHHRNPGVAGAVLASDAPAMLICDGEHVHPAVVKMLLRAKGTERVILVTDAISGAGMETGESAIFGQRVYIREGRATLENGTLAGSVLTLNRAVSNAYRFGALAFGAALQMATSNPARLLNDSALGALAQGGPANLAVMDPDTGSVALTIVRGHIAYRQITSSNN